MRKNYFRYKEFIFLTFLTLLSLFTGKAVAQTTLAVGDLSIVSINSNTTDAFTFVTWVNLLPNTEIKFTDNGFHNGGLPTAPSNFRDQEQTVTWRNNTGAAIDAGKVITITLSNPATTNLGEIVSSLGANGNAAAMLLTNNSGDQIFAYQGIGATAPVNNVNSNFNGTIIFAIGFSGWNVAATNWVTSGAISGATSYLPSTVTGNSSVFLGPNVAGAQYNGPTSGLAAYGAYKAAIANPANWTLVTNSSGVIPPFPVPIFTAGALPVFTANPPNRTICLGNNTTFAAAASNATSHQWQENSGSGFANLSNGGVYSGAATATLTITGATAGMNGYTYRLVATGTGGSANSNAATLTVSNPTVTAGSQTNVSCFGGSNGSATVTASGGIAPYTYSWSPSGGTGASATGLTAGTYTVTITDNIGCTTTRNFTVTQPASAVSGTTAVTNVACSSGTNGAINLTPSGGTGPYTFNWGGGITSEDRTALAAGTYSVTITDANGCTATVAGITVTQPVNAITATASQINVSCNGGSNGTASVAASGGTGPYTYLWSPSGGTAATASGLSAGTYMVTITDANSCTTIRNFTITQPAALTATTAQTNVS
ncbi:beta strand repeat-containing protein, partial [Flavobacterium macacae]|uniref:beta strand repeat-containing protein n=1 Tax=Flavobacterium macacae TaxID=2488993 RepID=UPI0018F40052